MAQVRLLVLFAGLYVCIWEGGAGTSPSVPPSASATAESFGGYETAEEYSRDEQKEVRAEASHAAIWHDRGMNDSAP